MTSTRRDGATRLDGFTARVILAVRRIPPGRVATYGDVAAMAGQPRAARAVGNIMRRSGAGMPAHRVVAAGGRLGGYGGNETVKRALLVAEGVPFSGRRILLDRCRITRAKPRRGRKAKEGRRSL